MLKAAATNNMNEIVLSNNLPFSSTLLVYCEVIIPINLPNTYTWEVPEHLQKNIQPGIRVEVLLRNKKYAGIVKKSIIKSRNYSSLNPLSIF